MMVSNTSVRSKIAIRAGIAVFSAVTLCSLMVEKAMSQTRAAFDSAAIANFESKCPNLAKWLTGPAREKAIALAAEKAGIKYGAFDAPKPEARKEDVTPAKADSAIAEETPAPKKDEKKEGNGNLTPSPDNVPALGEKQAKSNDIDQLGYDIQGMNAKDSANTAQLRTRLYEMIGDTAISSLGLAPVLNIVINAWNSITGENVAPVVEKKEAPAGTQGNSADTTSSNTGASGAGKASSADTTGSNGGNSGAKEKTGGDEGVGTASSDSKKDMVSGDLVAGLQQLFADISKVYETRIGGGTMDSITAMGFAGRIFRMDSAYREQLQPGSNEFGMMASAVNMLLSVAPYNYRMYNRVLGKYASPLLKPKGIAAKRAEKPEVKIAAGMPEEVEANI